MTKPHLQTEALRLRLEERMSLAEIRSITGASKGVLSLWLREHPLTGDEASYRRRKKRSEVSVRHDPARKSRIVSRFKADFDTDDMDTGRKGRIAEAAVMLRLVSMGFTVYKSAFDGARVDLIAHLGDPRKVARLQVKWASLAPSQFGRPTFSLQRAVGCRSALRRKVGYETEAYDFIVGYDFKSDLAYVFSKSASSGRDTSLTVTDASEENWQQVVEFVN
jgi:hypothetical protein